MTKAVFEKCYELYKEYQKTCEEFGTFSNEAEMDRMMFCVAYSIIEKAGEIYEMEYQVYKEKREKEN